MSALIAPVLGIGAVAGILIAVTVLLCRDAVTTPRAPAPEPRDRRVIPTVAGSRNTLNPLFLTADAHAWVLDGIMSEPSHAFGSPVSLQLRPPDSGWLGIIIEELLRTWVDEGRAIDLDFTKVGRPHRTIGLSCEDTHFWLELAAAPGLPGAAGLEQAA